MKIAVIAALAVAGTAGAAAPIPDISTLDPAVIKTLIPEKIDWRPAEGLTGVDVYKLVGDQAKPGFYVVLNRFHPGSFSHPHYHPADRYIMVVSGTWWVATGPNFDPERNTVPLPAGSFATHLGNEVHYDGSRAGTEGAVVMIFGNGPGARIDCTGPKAEVGPGPCADALAKARH
jgi:quercetin dioxygenase-like cupin family protein